jgi:hypothetical protein
MTKITQLARQMQDLFQTRANELAWESGFMERERVITGSSFASGLVSAYQSDSLVSLAGLSQAIGNAGTPITRQGVHERFTPEAITFMKAMLDESLGLVVQGSGVPNKLLDRFEEVVLTDSTVITLPNAFKAVWQGSGGSGENASVAAVKISVRWQLRQGRLQVMHLSDATTHDRTAMQPYPVCKGRLYIQDLGYFSLAMFDAWSQQGAYWLTRYKVGTHLMDAQHKPLDLALWLPKRVGQQIDCPVLVGKSQQLPCRLVAQRVPKHVVQQRQVRIRETARQNQTTPSAQALALAPWTLYLTNADPQLLAGDEIFLLGRSRWQIECLFKFWKQGLQVDCWKTQHPDRFLCELYAKLLAVVVTHWLFITLCWHNPRRSFLQALPALKGLAWQWANSLHDLSLLIHTLRSLHRALSCCQMDKSSHHPRHFQILEHYYA